jgi:predicted alpha/beta hydrolase
MSDSPYRFGPWGGLCDQRRPDYSIGSAALAARVAATCRSSNVYGLILNASCSVYYKGWGWASLGILAFAKFSDVLASALGYYPGNKLGFGGVEARGVIEDWYHTARTGEFMAKGSTFDYNRAMAERKIPIFGLSYQGDSSAPPAALKNLLQKFSSADITYHHVLHPPKKKYDHYSWVKKPELSLPLITEWLIKSGINE